MSGNPAKSGSRHVKRVLFSILFWMLISGSAVLNAEITIHAAASLSEVLTELGNHYQQRTGENVVFNFGASSLLARQIEQGAPGDLFFSADAVKVDQLQRSGLLAANTRKDVLSNTLVIVVPTDSQLKPASARDLASMSGNIAVAEPNTVPAGIYARQYLQKMDVWEIIHPRIVPTENVRGALAAVESGNVEAAIVYKTDAKISRKVKIAYEVPKRDGPRIRYVIVILKRAAQRKAVTKFYEFLTSARAVAAYRKYGFLIDE